MDFESIRTEIYSSSDISLNLLQTSASIQEEKGGYELAVKRNNEIFGS